MTVQAGASAPRENLASVVSRYDVRFRDAEKCRTCKERICVAMCSGQAIAPDSDGLPLFDREKCVLCGACVWNCPEVDEDAQTNLVFGPDAAGPLAAED